MNLQKLGVWAAIDGFSAVDAAAFAQRVEAWGYGALWYPEAVGREAFSAASWLLARTRSLVVATGIANIYARDALSAASAQKGLNEQSGGRFLLGLGVSHIPLVEGLRQHQYGKPVATMRDYLRAMAAAPYKAVAPAARSLTVLAALGPKMLELAAAAADGAHPYNVTPEHTAEARALLGRDKLLCVEQAAILDQNPVQARATARKFLAVYMGLPNYVNAWKRLGFTDADVAGGGSDRLIDSLIVWGDEKAIRARIDAHWQAGADHVCVQAVSPAMVPDQALLGMLAPGAARASELPGWIQDHLKRYLATDGADGYWWDASLGGGTGMVPTLLLTTVGRKSGRELTMPLIFGQSGEDYVIVASKGGAPQHPAWYLNLQANPDVTVQVKGDRFKARAHTASGEERARWWSRMVEIYAPYTQYQTKTEREIPVVVLRRA